MLTNDYLAGAVAESRRKVFLKEADQHRLRIRIRKPRSK